MEQLGVGFVSLGVEVDKTELRQTYGKAYETADCVSQVEKTLAMVGRQTPAMVEELTAECKNADLLISLPYQLAGRIVYELTSIPFISVHLSPFAGYSKRFSAATAAPVNDLRAYYGLIPIHDPLGIDGSSSLLAMHAVSPEIIRRPKHWPSHFVMTGFLFLDEPWVPDPHLERFLQDGPPPVVISFGSMIHTSPEDVASVVFDAISRSGCRAIVQRGWSGLPRLQHSSDIYFADFVPHSWLFPRAACVIHAGGAGTTAAALRAGTPSVIVPHWLDQFLWAQLMQERGCASCVVPFVELNSDDLLSAVLGCLDLKVRASVTEVASKIQTEEGVENGVEAILRAVEASAAG